MKGNCRLHLGHHPFSDHAENNYILADLANTIGHCSPSDILPWKHWMLFKHVIWEGHGPGRHHRGTSKCFKWNRILSSMRGARKGCGRRKLSRQEAIVSRVGSCRGVRQGACPPDECHPFKTANVRHGSMGIEQNSPRVKGRA